MKIDKFSIIAHSGGLPFALACAHSIPEQISHVALVSGMPPTTMPEASMGMPLGLRIVNVLARNVPGISWLLMQMQRKILLKPAIFKKVLQQVSEPDRVICQDSTQMSKMILVLKEALINNLQKFLLELGTRFSFIGRQKRLTFDGDHFYADLVFYHVILKCYVIIDLKTRKLNHADLGQMQLYVNYFDEEIKQENDSPTIGLVLCTEKSEAMAKYLLGDKAKQIFASKYQLHLPTEEQLKKEIKREVAMVTHQNGLIN